MAKELMIANAFASEEKLKNFINRISDFSRKIVGEDYCYCEGDKVRMKAKYTPLFEIEDGTFKPFLDIPVPETEDEFRAVIATLYTKNYFIDYIKKENREIWIGLNNPQFFD
jgi:hypothetical protein